MDISFIGKGGKGGWELSNIIDKSINRTFGRGNWH